MVFSSAHIPFVLQPQYGLAPALIHLSPLGMLFLCLNFTGLDIADISLPLQLIGLELCTRKTGNSVMLMRTFVEGIQDVIDVNQFLNLSEHSLIGKCKSCTC